MTAHTTHLLDRARALGCTVADLDYPRLKAEHTEMYDLLTAILPLITEEAERRRMAGPEELEYGEDGPNPYWTEMERAEEQARALLARIGAK